MTRERRLKLVTYARKFPEAIGIAILTAVTTVVLALILALVTGGQSREDRAATRCYAAQTHAMILEVLQHAPSLDGLVDLGDYPPINTEGLDCELYFIVPIEETDLP